MKRFLLIAALVASSFTAKSQALGYEDLALLFSSQDLNGSARFVGMSGAFGALGGDVTALAINPAGMSVFNRSNFSVGFNTRTTDINTTYYGNSILTQDQYFNLNNAGAILVFNDAHSKDWGNFAFGVNYRILKDFDNVFFAAGNSGFATFIEYPDHPNQIVYDQADGQEFDSFFRGENVELSFGFSTEYQEKLYLGASINTYSLSFSQQSTLFEFNNDVNGNLLDANFYQENFTSGAGFSLGLGFIYRINDMFRIGGSYQSPTWYTEIIEDSNITNNDGFDGDVEIIVSDLEEPYRNTDDGFFPILSNLYKLRTPSKLTASAAVVFGKVGLLSFDYTSRNYQSMNLSGRFDYSPENLFFDNALQRTNAFNVGTEWRINKISLRGGYRFEENPEINASSSEDLQGYSLGLGFSFGNVKLDLAYSDDNRDSFYNFYPQYNQVNSADLQIDNKVFTASIAFSL